MIAALLLLAATSDCTATVLRDIVCADTDLRAADAALVRAEGALIASSPRKASLRQRAAAFRATLVNAYDGMPRAPFTRDQLLDQYREERDDLADQVARDASVDRSDPTRRFADACFAHALKLGCRVDSAGWTNGKDGLRIMWQIQSGATETDGVGAGVMLWDASVPAKPSLIGWSFDGVTYEAPKLNMDSPEPLLWVAGTRAGTAAWNADLLFAKRGGQWVEIETESWRDDLDTRLPKGYGVWKGIDYDFIGMGGSSDLWRKDDANCCATGGRIYFEFAVEGTSLVLKDVQLSLTDDMRGSRSIDRVEDVPAS